MIRVDPGSSLCTVPPCPRIDLQTREALQATLKAHRQTTRRSNHLIVDVGSHQHSPFSSPQDPKKQQQNKNSHHEHSSTCAGSSHRMDQDEPLGQFRLVFCSSVGAARPGRLRDTHRRPRQAHAAVYQPPPKPYDLTYSRSKMQAVAGTEGLMSKARERFGDKPYSIVTLGGPVMVLPVRFADEIRSDARLSFTKSAEQVRGRPEENNCLCYCPGLLTIRDEKSNRTFTPTCPLSGPSKETSPSC